jgi:hypothetical protein
MIEFIVNEYITLKLERNKTNIYVDGKIFKQCKYLAFNVPFDHNQEFDMIESVDEMEQRDRSYGYQGLNISPEQEFWGHCSNLQAWVELGYDTRMLHRNLAFPLLRELVRIGDPVAKKVFKEEIFLRVEEGNVNVVRYLLKQRYFDFFSKEEFEALSSSLRAPKGILTLWGLKNKAPESFFENLNKLQKDVEFAKWGVQNKAPESFYKYFDKVLVNVKLAKLGFQNKAPAAFYQNFDALIENVELAEWGAKNKANNSFYYNFNKIQENIELAKWGIQNKAPESFFDNFIKLQINVDFAKWGIQNKAQFYFYDNFIKLQENIEFAKWGVQNKAPYSFYSHFEELQENIKLAKWGIQSKSPYDFYEHFDQIKENIDLAKWGVLNKVPAPFYENFTQIQEDFSILKSLRISKKKKANFLEKFSKNEEN